MSEKRLENLEKHSHEQQIILGEIKGFLVNIERNITQAIAIKDIVIKHEEKHKFSEARITKLEQKIDDMQKLLNSMNLKIATVSGAWTVIIYAISKL